MSKCLFGCNLPLILHTSDILVTPMFLTVAFSNIIVLLILNYLIFYFTHNSRGKIILASKRIVKEINNPVILTGEPNFITSNCSKDIITQINFMQATISSSVLDQATAITRGHGTVTKGGLTDLIGRSDNVKTDNIQSQIRTVNFRKPGKSNPKTVDQPDRLKGGSELTTMESSSKTITRNSTNAFPQIFISDGEVSSSMPDQTLVTNGKNDIITSSALTKLLGNNDVKTMKNIQSETTTANLNTPRIPTSFDVALELKDWPDVTTLDNPSAGMSESVMNKTYSQTIQYKLNTLKEDVALIDEYKNEPSEKTTPKGGIVLMGEHRIIPPKEASDISNQPKGGVVLIGGHRHIPPKEASHISNKLNRGVVLIGKHRDIPSKDTSHISNKPNGGDRPSLITRLPSNDFSKTRIPSKPGINFQTQLLPAKPINDFSETKIPNTPGINFQPRLIPAKQTKDFSKIKIFDKPGTNLPPRLITAKLTKDYSHTKILNNPGIINGPQLITAKLQINGPHLITAKPTNDFSHTNILNNPGIINRPHLITPKLQINGPHLITAKPTNDFSMTKILNNPGIINGPHLIKARPQINGPYLITARPQINGPHLITAKPQINGPHLIKPKPQINGPHLITPKPQINGPHLITAKPTNDFSMTKILNNPGIIDGPHLITAKPAPVQSAKTPDASSER